MSISDATSDDILALADFFDIVFGGKVDIKLNNTLQIEGLRRAISSPEAGRILIWREDGHVRGMINLLFRISMAGNGKAAIVEDMFVHPDFRGKGIGSQLLTSAIELCRALGYFRISLLTDTKNSAAQRFYERHGFRTVEVTMMRRRLR